MSVRRSDRTWPMCLPRSAPAARHPEPGAPWSVGGVADWPDVAEPQISATAVNVGLRAELLDMFVADQAALRAFLSDADSHRERFALTQTVTSDTPWPYVLLEWDPADDAPATARQVLVTVKANTARLQQIAAAHGWPGRSLVGEDGADAAWLVLQHTNSQVTTIRSAAGDEFCRSCAALLREAVARGEAHPRHLAAITDSIRLADDEPPEFASLPAQYSVDDLGRPVFRWDIDPAGIDRRRAAIGLPPLAADIARRRAGSQGNEIGPDTGEAWPGQPAPPADP
jgi:hypothetical protein